jgi:hypothetical protein
MSSRRVRAIISVMSRIAALFAALLLLAGCAASEPRWVGDNLHEVDGYLVERDVPCPSEEFFDCAVEVAAARALLEPNESAQVVGFAMVSGPTRSIDPSGRIVLSTVSGGLTTQTAVAIEFADGRRRVITLQCGPGLDAAPGSGNEYGYRCRPHEGGLPRIGDVPVREAR